MEEEQNSSIEEVAPQDSESVVVESSEQPESAQPVESTAELEDKQERNWKETRRKQREAEIKIKAQEELIEKLLKTQQPVQEKAPEPDEFANIAADDYLTKEQSERLAAKRAEEIAEKKYRQMEAQREQDRFMERLKSEYSDFADVVNPDSIAILEEKVPKLAQTIADLKDPYKMGLQTYHYLKAMNLGGEVSEKRHAKEVEKKLEKNENIVQSPQAYNKRPMAQAFQSSKAEMSKLYEEMIGYANQAGSGY
jgi:hypothetical protein